MSRPPLPAGKLGKISFDTLPSGVIRARARMRTDGGELRRISGSGTDEVSARGELERKAARFSSGYAVELHPDSTLAVACEVWLAEKRAYGQVETSTIEAYENNVRLLVIPLCGAILLKDLTAGRCDNIIQKTILTKSASAATRLRKTLSSVLAVAVRHGAIENNPISNVQRISGSKKRNSYLTYEQLTLVRALIRQWRSPSGVDYDIAKLEDGMDIMIGSSARVGEVLALRRQDVDLTSETPSVLIDGTMRQTRAEGLHRKDSAKNARQRRRIALPQFAITAVKRRLELARSAPDAFLFATSSGRAYSVSNFERILRTFVKAHTDILRAAGINVEQFSSHIFRRTAATIVEQSGGITLASRLLGHANEGVTRASYVVSAEQVDPATATILNDAFGSSRDDE